MLILLLFLLSLHADAQNRSVLRKGTTAEVSAIESYVREVDRFIKGNPKSLRIYADVSSGTEKSPDEWREFKNEKEREVADTGDNLNENAYVWLREGKVVEAKFTFQSPSRDWVHYVTYYFRENGSLAKMEAQLNTFYGNMSVIRERWYNAEGKLLRSASRYLDIRGGKRKKPDKDFIDEPIPFYRRAENLPFYRLLWTAQPKNRLQPTRLSLSLMMLVRLRLARVAASAGG